MVEDEDSLTKTYENEYVNNNFNESDDDVIECSSEEDIVEIKQNGSSTNQINSVTPKILDNMNLKSQNQHQLANRVNLNNQSKENSENEKNGCIQIE